MQYNSNMLFMIVDKMELYYSSNISLKPFVSANLSNVIITFHVLHDFDIHFIIFCNFTKVPCNLGHIRRRKVNINVMSVVRLRKTKAI